MRGVSPRPAGRTLAILLPGTRKTCITKTYPEASASFWAGLDPRLREDDGKLRHPRPNCVIPGYDRESMYQIGLEPPSLLGF